jgi:hypothetical protein
MALLAAVGLETLPVRWAALALLAILVEAGLNQQHDFRVPEGEKPKLELATLAQDHIPLEGHVVVVGQGNPLELYLLNRKGWIHDPAEPFDPRHYTQHGPAWLLIPAQHAAHFPSPGTAQFRDEHYALHNLN